MPTIEFSLLKSTLISDSYSTVKESMSSLKSLGTTLNNQLLFFDSTVCNIETMKSQIQSVSDRQDLEITSLDNLIEETDDFFELVAQTDEKVGTEISSRKDDFYEEYSYLKPDCEKNGWEKFCDWCSDAAEWCAEHWAALVTLIVVVVVVAAITIATIASFGSLGPVLVGLVALVGGMVGLVSQLVSDVINLIITGDWDGNFISYFSAFVGGAFGGVVSLATGNPYLVSLADSAVSSLLSSSLEDITGIERHSMGDILFDGLFSVGLSLGFSFCFDKLAGKLSKKLSNIKFFSRLSGRNSYEASYKMSITRLKNGTFETFGYKTVRNGVVSQLAGGSLSTIAGGVFDGIKERIEERNDNKPSVNPKLNVSPIVIPDVPVFEIPAFSW